MDKNSLSVTKSLRERDGLLVNQWYVACLTRELGKKPVRRILYDQAYVIYRDEKGKAVCLPDRCLHRAAQLSLGNCEDGKITCPYHGWKYNSLGEVIEIPSEGPGDGDQPVRANLKLKSIPTFEQDGCIWIWTGEAAPASLAPPWRFPHYNDPLFSKYFMITDFDNEVTHLCENFMDVPHTVFVHKGWFRTRAMREVPMSLDVKNGSVLITYHQENDSIGFTSKIVNPKGNPMLHTDQYIFPNLTRVDYNFGPEYHFIINSQCTPIGALKTRVYTYIAFRVGKLTKLLNPLMRFYTRQVIEQDVDIMKNQGDNFKLDFSHDFKSTDADELHIAIERIREMGVRGDPELFNFQRKKEKSFWI